MKECGILLRSPKKGQVSKSVDFFAAISLGISDLLQHGHGIVSVTEEEGEERGSTKEEIAEQEDQRPGEGPKVAIPSA